MKLFYLAALLVLANTNYIFSDEQAEEIPVITIDGERGEEFIPLQSTAGAKTRTPIEEIPQSVSVLGKEEMEQRGVQKVDEALRYTPGVLAQPFGSDSDTDWIYIRGFDATQNGKYLDGLQLFSYGFAGFITDTYLIDEIEVLRGPASVLYGGASAGGLINIKSKLANGENFYNVDTGVNSDLNGYGGFDIGHRFSDFSPWSFRVTGLVKGGETGTEYADNLRTAIAPSLLFDPDEDTTLEIYSSFQYDKQRHETGFLPYEGTVVEAPSGGYIPRDLYINEPDEDVFEGMQASIGYKLEHTMNDRVTLVSNTRWFYTERQEYGPYILGWNATRDALSRINFAHDTAAHLAETDNQALFRFDTAAVEHNLMTGVNYQFYRLDHWQATGDAPDLDPWNPVYGNPLPDLNDPYLDEVITMNKAGIYMQDQMKFGEGWIITANGRYDSYWTDRRDRAYGADYQIRDGALSGRAGLAYTFDSGFTPYTSISRFFEPQIGTDGDGDPVDAQRGEQYEAGVKYVPSYIDAFITLSFFDVTRRNTLQQKFVDGGWVTDTLGEVQSQGMELEVKAKPLSGLTLAGGLTLQKQRITDDVDPGVIGKRPYLIPAVAASFTPYYTIENGWAEGLSFGGGVRYQGKTYADNENDLEVPAYTVLDLGIHYRLEHWNFSFNVSNLLDTVYTVGNDGAMNYGEGRTILLRAATSY